MTRKKLKKITSAYCKRERTMKHRSKLPKPLRTELSNFFEQHPPRAFSNALRRLLLDYMQKQVRTGFPIHFDRLLWALSDLFNLLDKAAFHLPASDSKIEDEE